MTDQCQHKQLAFGGNEPSAEILANISGGRRVAEFTAPWCLDCGARFVMESVTLRPNSVIVVVVPAGAPAGATDRTLM